MNVKQAVRVYSGRWQKEKNKALQKMVIRHFVSFALGVLFSFSGFNKEFSPFGIAFSASVSKDLTLTASLGAMVGWFFALDSVSALRYTSAVFALCVIMTALKPFKPIRDNSITPSVVVFVCLFVTGLAIAFADSVSILSVMLCFAESVVGSVTSYLLMKSFSSISLKGGLTSLTSKEASAIFISVMILLLSLRNVNIFGVYPVHIVISLLILTCGYYTKEAGGAIVGICGGITMGLSGADMFLLSFYSFGGLLSGVFSCFGRIASVVAFIFTGLAVGALSYDTFENYNVIIETLVASLVFIVLSYKFDEQIKCVLKPSVTSPIIDTVKSEMFYKIKNASAVSTEICSSLTSVNDALSKLEKSDITYIPKKTKERVCGSCGLYDSCWGESFENTQDAFNTLLNMKKEGIYLEYKTVPQQFSARCIRTENVASSFNRLYGEYKIRRKNEMRFKEMNSLVAEQFVNVSSLLDSLCEDLDKEICFDMDTAARIRAAATNCSFQVLECCCVINELEKMTVEIKIKTQKGKITLSPLSEQIRLITSRSFELPLIDRQGECTRFVYKEKSEYKILNSGVQFCANGEKYSGDTFSTFEDGKGLFYAVICDGMGTGTKAALASGLAVTLLEKLIKGGFGIKAAINTVNTSLISKSGEECSVTLDLIVIDLFTGHTEFYKCGAADSVVKKNNRLIDISFSSLPLGILSNTEISCGTGTLGVGDAIVMFSDGVREEDLPYLKKSFKDFKGGNIRGFTCELCENIRRYQDEKNDDLTVITLVLTNNE